MQRYITSARICAIAALLLLLSTVIITAQTSTNGVTTENVAIRSAPKNFAPVFDSLAVNTRVIVSARDLNATWFFVRTPDGNVEGWVPNDFLQVETPVPQGTASGFVDTGMLNVRWEPNFSREPITQLERGETVIISGQDASGNWYFVQRPDNRFGWVSARYIAVTAGNIDGTPIWMNVTAYTDYPDDNPYDEATGIVVSAVNVLVGIGDLNTAQVVTSLNVGDEVTVLASARQGSYYLVRLADGRLGWVQATSVQVSEAVQGI